MKKRLLEQGLKNLGWWKLREGGSHEVWTNGEITEPVPRHREIGEELAKKILRKARANPPKLLEADMYFQGNLKKDGRFWMIEVPDLDVATQGRTKKEALEMIVDAIEILVNNDKFKVSVMPGSALNEFLVTANDPAMLVALFLKRQRENKGFSIREVAKRMKYKTHNSYAQFETGKHLPGLEFVDRFLKSVDPDSGILLTRVVR